MNILQRLVLDFHVKYDHFRQKKPDLVPWKVETLRVRLLDEEVNEFVEASWYHDLQGIADALGDILVVTFGAAVSYGIDIEPIFLEIHRSNMTKAGKDEGGKTIKGPDYEPPRIAEIIERQKF